ncbi:MAG: ABC transporter permease subunit [Blastocatellia bacterium]|nr:ABC transporter permease subunit [Blastocatellia bacterium]MCS7158483.1 ABC transporter permease subunit [Blastocatellia bacterium]MCX7753446.1 ABC transporter permease subunit [Blastocatellia bacterium]MDW8167836.1 ABC transporter permease subunit [Acidobacteriota bacterium]MDW8255871.1 ABC transporter permease subunit [Acidobacteriota bacterium]
MSPVLVILRKEWTDLRRHRLLVLSMVVPALVFLLLPFILTILIPLFDPSSLSDQDFLRMIEVLGRAEPELRRLDPLVVLHIYIFRQFVLMLLLVPILGALSIATYSIIGEKQNRTLEPLLATPIATTELLWGKSLAAAIPATLLVWATFGLYVLGIRALSPPEVLPRVANPVGLGLIFLIGPLVAVLSLGLGVIVSSRAKDPRTAQQVGVVLILPIMALFIMQMRGFFLLDVRWLFVGAAALLALDVVLLKIGARLFERETILTRWG